MARRAYHSDEQLAAGWLRSAAKGQLEKVVDSPDAARRLRVVLTSERGSEPLVVTGARLDYSTGCTAVQYLRAVGMGVEMSAFVFRNLMDLWPADVTFDTAQLLSRNQLVDVFGDVFGPLLADVFSDPQRQPMLASFVHRQFDVPVPRAFEKAVLEVGSSLGAKLMPETMQVSPDAAALLVSDLGGYTLLTHQRFSPEHEFYASVVQSGQALWEALGHLD